MKRQVVFWSAVDITIYFWHAELADPGIVVRENVNFGSDVDDSTNIL